MFQTVATKLIWMVVFINQAVRSEDVRSIIGYIGESVVLRSEVDPSWTLRIIHWSIYTNTTLIASFVDNDTRVNRWPPFKGRLDLNTISGDLTIKNIMARDEMEYKVSLTRQGNTEKKTISVQLDVREQFPKPNISLLHSFLDAGKCVISLKCSSLSSNISLKWEAEPGFSERLWSDSPNVTSESVMWTSFGNKDVSFSCIATDHNLKKSSQLSVICPEPGPCSKTCCVVLVICIIILITISWICKDELKSKCYRCFTWLRDQLRNDREQQPAQCSNSPNLQEPINS